MTGKTHLIIGIASGLAFIHFLPAPNAMIAAATLAAAAIGSLAPDIDAPESTINRLLPPLRLTTFFIKHRGILHSIFIPILMSIAVYFFAPIAYQLFIYAFAIGYASHIAADAITIQGIPLLSPIPYQIHLLPKIFRIRTGGIVENLTAFGIILGILYYGYLVVISP